MEDICVGDLFIPNCRMWDCELLEDLFNARDVDEILKIPLSGFGGRDMRVWNFNNRGLYTVKSGYHLAMELLELDGHFGISGDWQHIWSLQVPPKVRSFLWRLARDCLPHRINLQKKGITVSSLCAVCNSHLENSWHLFLRCSIAEQCWKQVGLWDLVDKTSEEVTDIQTWLFAMLQKASEVQAGVLSMLLWSLWHHRNVVLWSNKLGTAISIVYAAKDLLCQWLAAKQFGISESRLDQFHDEIPVWNGPPSSFMKCNVDAASFASEGKTGFGMLVRDERGHFIAGRTCWFNSKLSSREAEALGLYQAISWCLARGYGRVVFELDAKLVVTAMQSTVLDLSEFGTIILNCKSIFNQGEAFSLNFVKRQANKVAHALARSSCCYASPYDFDEPPQFVRRSLDDDSHMIIK
ncbi:hypothetical protein PTKIN_Ptkin04bG0219100 [Pterospermum kingtungense]